MRQRVQLQQNNYHAGRKKAEHVTRIPCYRHCAAAFFLSSIYISQAFKITARCKDLLSDVMTSCLFCLSILCIFLDNNLQFPQFSLKKKLYPFCIICLLNILKCTEYYSKFAPKTLTFHRFYCMIILNIFSGANQDFVLLNNSGTFQKEISPLLVI